MNDNEITEIVGWPTESEMRKYRAVAAKEREQMNIYFNHIYRKLCIKHNNLIGLLNDYVEEDCIGRKVINDLCCEDLQNELSSLKQLIAAIAYTSINDDPGFIEIDVELARFEF